MGVGLITQLESAAAAAGAYADAVRAAVAPLVTNAGRLDRLLSPPADRSASKLSGLASWSVIDGLRSSLSILRIFADYPDA